MTKRILVVEDQEDNRQIIRDMLSITDYQITEAENGEEALTAVAKQRPDLILMDIQMPIMDGYWAARRIKADPGLRSIPIVAITSYAEMNRKRGRLAATIMCPSPIARVSFWRKYASTYPRCDVAFWSLASGLAWRFDFRFQELTRPFADIA